MLWEWLSCLQDCTFYRYRDDSINRVNARYYGSSFLGYGNHQDLLKHFTSLTEYLNKGHLCQFSVDDPNENLKLFEELSHQFKKDNVHSFIDIGSCGLHIVMVDFQEEN